MNDGPDELLHVDDQHGTRVRLLVEEYRAVNQLLMFRLEAMESRLPLTAAGIGGLLVAAGALPLVSQVVLLVGIPIAVLSWVRGIILHAVSKEDAKDRIREIEREVAQICGQPVLRFQSEHPSATGPIGGRTGRQMIVLVVVVSSVALALCLSLFLVVIDDERFLTLYATGLGVCWLGMLHAVLQFTRVRTVSIRD